MKAADAYHKVRDNWQQAQQWLADSSAPVGEGSEAVRKVIQAGQEAALLLPQKERQELQESMVISFLQSRKAFLFWKAIKTDSSSTIRL